MFTKTYRILLIVTLATGVCWFAMSFGPTSLDVQAKVYDQLMLATKALPAYIFDEEATSAPRKILVNNNTTWLTVSKSKDEVKQVIDFYSKQYTPQLVEALPVAIINRIEDEEFKEALLEIEALLQSYGSKQQTVLITEEIGLWSGFDYFDMDLKIGSKEWFETVMQLSESGNIGKIGTGRAVIALRNQADTQTTILNIWTDQDYQLDNNKPDASGDVAGVDLANVPRYPASKRVFSIEQDSDQSLYRMVMYEGSGSIASHVLFFQSRMQHEGWKVDPVFDQVAVEQSAENTMFYVLRNRECTIRIARDTNSGQIITTIVEGQLKS